MKFITKIFLILVIAAQLAPAHANGLDIYYVNSEELIAPVKEIFLQGYGIPDELIEVYQVPECPKNVEEGYRIKLCINEKELDIIYSNSFIIESLRVFRREKR